MSSKYTDMGTPTKAWKKMSQHSNSNWMSNATNPFNKQFSLNDAAGKSSDEEKIVLLCIPIKPQETVQLLFDSESHHI